MVNPVTSVMFCQLMFDRDDLVYIIRNYNNDVKSDEPLGLFYNFERITVHFGVVEGTVGGKNCIYKINIANIIKQRSMKNQLQFANSPTAQQSFNSIAHHKYTSPTNLKAFDKTLPSPNIKHYSSNPNLSLEFMQAKSPSNVERPPYNANNLKKSTMDFRAPPMYSQPQPTQIPQNSRPSRNEMAKSLILGEQDHVDMPEDNGTNNRDLFKEMPKRQYRKSETIQDLPPFLTKKEEQIIQSPKETNFLKKESFDQRDKAVKQKPAFLSRPANEMKRSLVVEPSFEANRAQLTQSSFLRPATSAKSKVTVDDFVKVKQLGNGKYGRVFLVREKYSGFMCALKIIEKKLLHEQQITDQFIREVKIQMFLNHPNIIKMYGCFDDSTNIYIILEVGTGGQLYHQLKKSQPLSQPRIAFIMKQVCEAVNEIHSLRIIHRDIKPENIVIHDNIIKLCDFGWSVHQDNKLRTTFCGTPLYVCPEILKGREYDEKIDIWSIGIMMYEMVVGENPFKITRQEELIKIVKDEIKIPSYLFVSAEVRDFLDRCLKKNPNERATIKELINHPFFKKHQEKEKSKVLNM